MGKTGENFGFMESQKYPHEDRLRKVKEYARSKKLDKEVSSGKAWAFGHVESQEEEPWGEQGGWEWEDLNAFSNGEARGESNGKGKGKGNGKGGGKGGGSGKSAEVVSDGKGNRYPAGGRFLCGGKHFAPKCPKWFEKEDKNGNMRVRWEVAVRFVRGTYQGLTCAVEKIARRMNKAT